jgi:hypothetical protein
MKLRCGFFLLLVGIVVFANLPRGASAQWNQATFNSTDNINGFFSVQNYLLLSVRSGGIAIATIDSLYASTDNGQTWMPFAPNGGLPLAAALNGIVPNLIGTASYPSSSGGGLTGFLSYSTNFGQTWSPDTLGWPDKSGLAATLTTIGTTIFGTNGQSGVYQQTSPGARWTPDTVGMTAGGVPYSVGAMMASGTNLFAATLGGGVEVSANMGASWTPVNNGLTSPQPGTYLGPLVAAFALSGTSLFAMIPNNNFLFDSLYNFYRTTDNGQHWAQMNSTPLKCGIGVARFAASGTSLFAASDSEVNVSTDNGKTWFQANQGLPNFTATFSNITSIQVSGGNLVIGILTLNQVWYRKLSDFAPSSVNNNSVTSFSLSESFPNPVFTSSKIHYSLSSDGMASLTLFDITGKLITTLANGYQSVGDHISSFDGQALPSGMYFYRLTTADGSIGHWLQVIK